MSDGQYTTLVDQRFLNEVAPRAPTGTRLLLYDFDTGRPDLLSRHAEGLDQYVLPVLHPRGHPTSVWIGGLASRRGNETFNRGLAFARAGNVERYLVDRAPGLRGVAGRHSVSTHYFGERYSTHHTENSPYYRAVLVILQPATTSRPRPRTPPPPQAYATNRFRILLLRGFDGGEVIAFGSYRFLIDYEAVPGAPASEPVEYQLTAGGGGIGMPVSAGSGNPRTDWNPFVCDHVTTTRGFDGRAHWFSYGAGLGIPKVNAGNTSLTMFTEGSSGPIRIDPFRVETSAGLGLTAVYGPFTRVTDG